MRIVLHNKKEVVAIKDPTKRAYEYTFEVTGTLQAVKVHLEKEYHDRIGAVLADRNAFCNATKHLIGDY